MYLIATMSVAVQITGADPVPIILKDDPDDTWYAYHNLFIFLQNSNNYVGVGIWVKTKELSVGYFYLLFDYLNFD